MLLDTPLKTKILSFFGMTLEVTFWLFSRKLVAFWLALQDGKVFGSISYENPTIFCLLDL